VQTLEEKAGWLSSEFPVPSQETSRVSRSGFLLPWFLLPCFGRGGSVALGTSSSFRQTADVISIISQWEIYSIAKSAISKPRQQADFVSR